MADTNNNICTISFDTRIEGCTVSSMSVYKGTAVKNLPVILGSPLGTLPYPEAGYVFLGWYDGEELITQDTIIDEDITLTARWSTNITLYKIILDTSTDNEEVYGKLITTILPYIYVKSDEAIGEDVVIGYGPIQFLPIPERENAILDYWYYEDNGSEIKVDEDTKISSDLTLYVKWKIKKYIDFDCAGGTSISRYYENIGITINNLSKQFITTKIGYKFNGWSLNGEKLDSDSIYFTDNIILIALWEPEIYTLSFIYENGLINYSTDIAYNKAIEPLPVVENTDNNIFSGWYNQNNKFVISNLSLEQLNFISFDSENDLTFIPRWANKCTITYNPNGGECDIESIVVPKKSIINNFPKPTRDGYVFVGWYTNDYDGYMISNPIIVEHNLSLYAHWQEINFSHKSGTINLPAYFSQSISDLERWSLQSTISRERYYYINSKYYNIEDNEFTEIINPSEFQLLKEKEYYVIGVLSQREVYNNYSNQNNAPYNTNLEENIFSNYFSNDINKFYIAVSDYTE